MTKLKTLLKEHIRKILLNEAPGGRIPNEEEFDLSTFNWQFAKPLFKIIGLINDKFNVEYEYDWDEKKLWLNYKDFVSVYKYEELSAGLEKQMHKVINELQKIRNKKTESIKEGQKEAIEQMAVDFIDYLGAELDPRIPWESDRRITNYFKDKGITDKRLMSRIYQKAMELNND